MLDLEKTEGNSLTEEDLGMTMIMQSLAGYATIFIYFNFFQGGKIKVFFILLITIIGFICIIVSQYGV